MSAYIRTFIVFITLGFAPVFAHAAGEAALFLNPASGSFLVGSTFDLSIVLDTKGRAVNTVEVELKFPADKIQIANPSIGKSLVQVWAAPPNFSNQEGRMYFIGGIPSPGVTTSDGVVLTLTFRVVAPGSGEIQFGGRTSVLANDGRGTDVLGQHPSAFLNFLLPPPQGPVISSPTHPDSERWYRDRNPNFVWRKSPFADGFSYSLDQNPAGVPDVKSDGVGSSISISVPHDGLWYFHVREHAGDVWGGVSHYLVKIDSAPPATFSVNVSPSRRTSTTNPIFRFFTTDALSGFDHFEMKIIPLGGRSVDESFFFEVSSPYQVPNLKSGRYQVIVRALDKAGNPQDEAVTMNIVGVFNQFITPEGIDLIIFFVPWRGLVDLLFIAVLGFGAFLFMFWRHNRYHLGHALRDDFTVLTNLYKKILFEIKRMIKPL